MAQKSVTNDCGQAPGGASMAGLTNRNVSYTLDRAGNRTNVNDTGVSTTYTPNNLNQYGVGLGVAS